MTTLLLIYRFTFLSNLVKLVLFDKNYDSIIQKTKTVDLRFCNDTLVNLQQV